MVVVVLPIRSQHSLFQLVVVCSLIGAVVCQSYDAESEYSDGDHDRYSDSDGEHHSEYDHPDYSKYYSVDTPSSSAPVQEVNNHRSNHDSFIPSELSGYFNDHHFGYESATNKKEVTKPVATPGFGLYTNSPKTTAASLPTRDYFEEAQYRQNADENDDDDEGYEPKPGPSYVSHKVAPKFDDKTKSASVKSESERDREELENYDSRNDKEDIRDIDDLYDSKKYGSNRNNVDATPVKYNFDSGKSSYVDPGKNNYSPQYYNKLVATPTLTPYQKYSFQPVDEYGFRPLPTEPQVAPYNPNYSNNYQVPSTTGYEFPDATATVATKIAAANNRNCHKVNKDLASAGTKAENMDCYACKDPKSGTSYEQCSYSSEPTPKSYYFSNSKTYKPVVTGQSYRFKRYTAKEQPLDPYEYVKANSQFTPEEEAASETYKVENDQYRFGPEYFSGGDDDKEDDSYSERESAKLANEGEHCEKKKIDGMTCMICKNEKTGGKYEQCAYATEPKEQKYAYVNEKKFSSKDAPEEASEDRPVRKSKLKKYSHPGHKGEKNYKVDVEHVEPANTHREKVYVPHDKAEAQEDEEESYDVPQHFEDVTNENKGVTGLDPNYYGSVDNEEYNADEEEGAEEDESQKQKENKEDAYDFGEYHFKFFPEFTNEESKPTEKRVPKPTVNEKVQDFQADDTKDVEAVLAEFAKKDRSKCTKAEKNGMTCYLCEDEKGLTNEECMYVSESKPRATHVAYHKAKEITGRAELPTTKDTGAVRFGESKKVLQKVAPIADYIATETRKVASPISSRVVRKLGRDKNLPKDLHTLETRIKRNTKYSKKSKKVTQNQNVQSDDEELEDDPSAPAPSNEYANLEGADGAFSAETRPVYSKVYGALLPKFFLEKSVSEKEFDDFVADS